MELLFFPLLALVLAWAVLLVFFLRKSKISWTTKNELKKLLQKTLQESDSRHKILDLDKILDQTLKELWFTGSLWEKMKKFWSGFKNENEIWFAHKLRNKFAHELNFQPSKEDLIKAEKAFKIEIENLLK